MKISHLHPNNDGVDIYDVYIYICLMVLSVYLVNGDDASRIYRYLSKWQTLNKNLLFYFHFTLQSLHTQFFFHICWSCFCLMSSVNIRNADTMCVMWLFTQYIQLSKMHRFVFVVFLFRFLLNFLQPANKFIHNILTYNTKCTFHTNNKFVVCINNRTRSKRTK